ncbi:uncharacterized protein TrAtP1_002281 [Trichoderma atroviride]|uniref:uncharacterized protein n=1 Tax=Hypocrea atroviridis TaxID=63577 RepID=UPI00332440D6|nr:hypothetical protein TrAtP1_002281 [Trichoderma atroviride]
MTLVLKSEYGSDEEKITGLDKQETAVQSWGATEGNADLKDEQADEVIAESEKKDEAENAAAEEPAESEDMLWAQQAVLVKGDKRGETPRTSKAPYLHAPSSTEPIAPQRGLRFAPGYRHYADGYVLKPRAVMNVTQFTYATLPNTIVAGQDSYLPMINLGDSLIHISKDTFGAGIALADLLGEDKQDEDEDEENPKLRDGYPLGIPNHQTWSVNLSTANISEKVDWESNRPAYYNRA